MNPIIIILSVLVVLLIAGLGFFFVSSQEKKRKQRLMNLVRGSGSTSKDSKNAEADLQNKRRAEIAKKLKESEKEDEAEQKKKKATITTLLAQAGLKISVKQYWVFSMISAVVLFLFAKVTGQPAIVLILAGVIGFFGIPRFVLSRMTKRRQKKFLEEFPDALEACIRLLKAGMPVSEAIAMISREFVGPVGEEMSLIYDKQKIGIPLHEAASEATYRMPLPEVQMFATGLAIQAQTGSSLSEVLQNLSNVIRARFKLKRKIKALSSEAVASASIIGSLPVMLSLGMYFANREYIMILVETTIGNFLLAAAVVWMSIGIIVMKIMINFKI